MKKIEFDNSFSNKNTVKTVNTKINTHTIKTYFAVDLADIIHNNVETHNMRPNTIIKSYVWALCPDKNQKTKIC